MSKTLSEAIETAETWLDTWIDNLSEDEDISDECATEERNAIASFQILLKTCKGIDRLQREPKECPHAAPHVYCNGCKVSPCPIGLD
jgi:hypothetical protein